MLVFFVFSLASCLSAFTDDKTTLKGQLLIVSLVAINSVLLLHFITLDFLVAMREVMLEVDVLEE